MNTHNKQKFKEIKEVDINNKLFNHFMDSISFQQKIQLILHVVFKTRRGLLFLTNLANGFSPSAAYNNSFTTSIEYIIISLDNAGWEISFGKLT